MVPPVTGFRGMADFLLLSTRRLARLVVIAVSLAATPALSEPILGTWISPPDKKGQIGYVVARKCGATYCGKLERVFDKNGKPTTTPNVGKTLFWDMSPRGGGLYSGGKAYVPIFGKSFDADVRVTGDKLKINGCVKALCKAQVWARAK